VIAMVFHRKAGVRPVTLGAAGAAVIALVLTGCTASTTQNSGNTAPTTAASGSPATQSSHDTRTQSAGPTSTPSQGTAGGRCHTSMLGVTLRGDQGSSGLGREFADVTLRDNSPDPCTIYGYSGLQLLGQDGAPLPTDVQREPDPAPMLVRVGPGETVHATVNWSYHEADDETAVPCEPTPAQVLVTPPDERDSLSTSWTMGPVCQHGAISITAFRK